MFISSSSCNSSMNSYLLRRYFILKAFAFVLLYLCRKRNQLKSLSQLLHRELWHKLQKQWPIKFISQNKLLHFGNPQKSVLQYVTIITFDILKVKNVKAIFCDRTADLLLENAYKMYGQCHVSTFTHALYSTTLRVILQHKLYTEKTWIVLRFIEFARIGLT